MHEVRSCTETPARHHANSNLHSVLIKVFALADKGARISFSKFSSRNFFQVRPSWLLSSILLTSDFCCATQFRHFLDTPLSSFFKQLSGSLIVYRAIHQERAVFLVRRFSSALLVISCPTLWCWLETHSMLTSTFIVCPLVDPLFIFIRCGLKSCFVTSSGVLSMSTITSANFLEVELSL